MSRDLLVPLWAACFLGAGGCAALGGRANEAPGVAKAAPGGGELSSLDDDAEEKKPLSLEDFSLDNIGKTTKRLTGQGPNRQVARELYRQADAKYREAAAKEGADRARLFAEAGPQFIAAANRWPDSALAMDALFMAGESMFFADQYVEANRHYERLVKEFPNNRYLDTVDQRRFAIAKFWLDLQKENPEEVYYVNWFDETRPWKDARGNGLRVLDKIRIDDPGGKLADDATLTLGNENLARRKFMKADEYYSDLRTAYPGSEHQFLAHFLGLKAKLSSYQGSAYGGTALDEAEKLIKQIRRQFPQESEKEREFLDRAMAEVRFRKAERLMFLAQYYDNRSEYRAAQHYYERTVKEFNDTPLAMKAEERVGQIAGLPPVPPQPAQWLVDLLPETDKVKPLLDATEQIRLAKAQRAAGERNGDIERAQETGSEPSLAQGVIDNYLDR
jgi:outer membrane protein assembly factor BamD (BamD/ComL family)